ncbi:MAG: flagella basal body P-ring formation protein FlgA [Candidatus Eisenbacteria bacterium]|nr:flagella basal body P-ring formation protein FlgA [Candidatus Eisenbacteria bacterium]MCC7144083.1 flagella basal body P-ring formation protein FlgA [Candidatus Eisenbacteria bacterium]
MRTNSRGGILPPLSLFLPLLGLLPGTAVSAQTAHSILLPVEEQLRDVAGCDSFRVEWSRALDRELARLTDARATIDPDPTTAARLPERVLVRVAGKRDGRAAEWTLFGAPQCYGPFYVAPHGMTSGAVCALSDLELREGWHPSAALTPIDPLAERLYAPRGLLAGRAIPRESLVEAPVVRRGEPVIVVYRDGGLELRAQALARKDAWIGDEITARVEGAARDCRGRINEHGELVVVPGGIGPMSTRSGSAAAAPAAATNRESER